MAGLGGMSVGLGAGSPGLSKGASGLGSISSSGGSGGLALSSGGQVKRASSGTTQSLPGVSSGGDGGAQDITKLTQLITGFQSGQQPQQAPAAPLVNSSTPNPTIDGTVLPTLLERAKGGMGADTAIRLAQGANRDMLSGTLKELKGGAARRGVGGSGAESLQDTAAAGASIRAGAKQSADIAYGAEQDRNKLLLDTAGTAANAEQLQNEQRRIGLSQWSAQTNANLEQQRINQSRDDRLLSILTQALF